MIQFYRMSNEKKVFVFITYKNTRDHQELFYNNIFYNFASIKLEKLKSISFPKLTTNVIYNSIELPYAKTFHTLS
jgi:hypothetical protein